MRILFLVKKETFLKKMSRVRFHGIKALEKLVEVKYSGPGWDDYDENRTVQENIDKMGVKFAGVIGYKPLELKDFKSVKILKIIRYNEMYDFNWTLKEIVESGSELIICHHLNDYETYVNKFSDKLPGKKFVYIGHCAEKTIFKKYTSEFDYDIGIAGRISNHYPLRNRFIKLLDRLKTKYRCYQHPHPGYNLDDAHTDRYLIEMAKMIDKCKIVLTDTGLPRSRYGKYIEIPMVGKAALCGDLPDDNADDYSFVIEVSNKMTDDEILKKIEFYLNNESERLDKVKLGEKFSNNYTQEHYAYRLLKAINEYKNDDIIDLPPEENTVKIDDIPSRHKYNKYDDYIVHQKKKTEDPEKRKKWFGQEWQYKIDVFTYIFKQYSNFFKEGMRGLCLGARTGQEVVALKNLGLKAVGIDIVPAEPHVFRGDIHKLAFDDNFFDVAYTNIFDHSLYPNIFIKEIERVLKPGGVVLLQLQLDVESDQYAENDIYKADSVIKLFKKSNCLLSRRIPNTLAMNCEVLMQKI